MVSPEPSADRPLSFDALFDLLAPDVLDAPVDVLWSAPPPSHDGRGHGAPASARHSLAPLPASPWGQLDFAELRVVAEREAARVLSASAGPEVDDVASQALHELLVYA